MTDAQKIAKLRNALRQAAVNACDGQNGSALYALDRLALIRGIAEAALKSTGDGA